MHVLLKWMKLWFVCFWQRLVATEPITTKYQLMTFCGYWLHYTEPLEETYPYYFQCPDQSSLFICVVCFLAMWFLGSSLLFVRASFNYSYDILKAFTVTVSPVPSLLSLLIRSKGGKLKHHYTLNVSTENFNSISFSWHFLVPPRRRIHASSDFLMFFLFQTEMCMAFILKRKTKEFLIVIIDIVDESVHHLRLHPALGGGGGAREHKQENKKY